MSMSPWYLDTWIPADSLLLPPKNPIAQMSGANRIEIFTKPAAPMSKLLSDGVTVGGYSIQFLKEFVAPRLGITDVRTTMLVDNNEIMSSRGLLSPTCSDDSNVVCIGAAAISITESREAAFDFTASYYTNNVRMLTTIEPEPTEILFMLISAVWQLVVGVILFFWFFNMAVAPVVWAIEMLTVPSTKLPIFMPADKAVDKFGGTSTWRRARFVMWSSFKSAVVWTVSTFVGSQLARPQSWVGRRVLLPLTRFASYAVGIIATAACAAIFTIDASQAALVGGFADLGPSHTVCYNTASSFNTALVTAKASEQRFSPLGFDGLAATLDAYYEQRCDAVIYDDVILQGDLLERRHSVAEGSASYGRVHKSGVVGASLKWDPYGFLLPSSHPMYETINRAVIAVATDDTVREELHAAHLRLGGQTTRGLDLSMFGSEWVWMPTAAALALIAVALVGVYINVVCVARRRPTLGRVGRRHSSAVKASMRAARMERGMADIALQPSHELIHEMAFEMQDLQTAVHDALEILQGMPTANAAAEPSQPPPPPQPRVPQPQPQPVEQTAARQMTGQTATTCGQNRHSRSRSSGRQVV